MDCYDRLLEPDNLFVAYLRARRAVEDYEGLVNREEFARWESSLDEHLDHLRDRLVGDPGRITCHLVPIPKTEGKVRAYYSLPLEYQVGWVAIVQALGPLLDRRMPSWSFGYRLHRPRARFADDEATWLWDDYALRSPKLYLDFARSWKPFRRYANLTVKRLLGDTLADDPREEEVRAYEERTAGTKGPTWCRAPHPGEQKNLDLRLFPFPYFVQGWRPISRKTRRVWFVCLDLRKFFPTLPCAEVHRRLVRELTGLPGFDRERWSPLLERWLNFHEGAVGIPPEGLKQLERERVTAGGLPVGLIASGFLANAYMMEVDRELEQRLAEDFLGQVALLRYVDDYVILCDRRMRLSRWLAAQFTVLHKHGLEVSSEKLRPAVLGELAGRFGKREEVSEEFIAWLSQGGRAAAVPDGKRKDAKEDLVKRWRREGSATRLDRKEFVSTALRRMSHRADEDVDLLDEKELDDRILDLTDLAETAEDHQEVRPDTLEAFAAAQLQRTPMWSPGATLEWKQLSRDQEEIQRAAMRASGPTLENLPVREQRIAEQLGQVRGHAIERIKARGNQMVRQVTASLVANPHKHRLLERWVRTATCAAEWWEDGTFVYKEEVRAFSALLAGRQPRSRDYRWVLSDDLLKPVKPAVLCFLRMRAWSALASCAEETLRAIAMVRGPTTADTSRWPSLAVRLQRRLTWLTEVARLFRRASAQARSARAGRGAFIAELEQQALHWWELFEKLADPRLRPDVFAHLLEPSASRLGINLSFARAALLPWTRCGTAAGARAAVAGRALEALAARVAGSRRPPADLEHRTLREWVLQRPEHRSRLELLKPMLQATVSAPSYPRDSTTVGWVSELAWKLAATPEGEAALKALAKARLPHFGSFIRTVARQRQALRKNEWTISLRALLEAPCWPDGMLAKPANEPVQTMHEAARVVLLRAILRQAETLAKEPGAVYLSPDNLFISSSDWNKIEKKVARGAPPREPRTEYRFKVRDPMFAIGREPDDILIASGLCGVVLASGQEAARRISRVGSRARLVLSSVWDAIESGPALSHELVRQLATLCAVGHLRIMNDRLREAYARLYGTRAARPESALRVLRSARTDLADLNSRLAQESTRREEQTLYVLESGLPTPGAPAPLGESLDVTVVQLDLDILTSGVWSTGGGTITFADEFIHNEAWPRLWRALRAVRASFSDKPATDRRQAQPRVVVLPELAVPRRYVGTLRRFAQAHDAVVVAGVEYRSEPGWATNEAIVAIPAPERHPAGRSRLFWVGKHYPAPSESRSLIENGIRFLGTRDFTIVHHPTVGRLGTVICYDLYAVEALVAFQRKVLHLVVPAYNRDLTTFDSLAEAAMRLLFANLILANTGRFGGSVVVTPFYKPYEREVLRVRGQHIDTVEHLSVPLAALELEQRKPKWPTRPPPTANGGTRAKSGRPAAPHSRQFKTKPADW